MVGTSIFPLLLVRIGLVSASGGDLPASDPAIEGISVLLYVWLATSPARKQKVETRVSTRLASIQNDEGKTGTIDEQTAGPPGPHPHLPSDAC